MPSINHIQEPEPLYSMAELKALRRDILQYARSFPPEPNATSTARSPCPCAGGCA
jgi:hypothetical protein